MATTFSGQAAVFGGWQHLAAAVLWQALCLGGRQDLAAAVIGQAADFRGRQANAGIRRSAGPLSLEGSSSQRDLAAVVGGQVAVFGGWQDLAAVNGQAVGFRGRQVSAVLRRPMGLSGW